MRVSTQDQQTDLQKDALTKGGCEKIFTDTISGVKKERPRLGEAIQFLRKGDTLIVWRLDRLGRSLKDLIEIVTLLSDKGIGFKSLTENVDTTTNGRKFFFHIFGALAEFERNLIRERTNAGLQAARARGRKGGRPKFNNFALVKKAKALHEDISLTNQQICDTLGISQPTLFRYLKMKVQ